MNWKKFQIKAVQYNTQPRRVYFTQSEKPGRVVANFLFHRKEPGGDPVDFPISIEVYKKAMDDILAKPQLWAIHHTGGRSIAVKVSGHRTPAFDSLPWWKRLFYRIAIMVLD